MRTAITALILGMILAAGIALVVFVDSRRGACTDVILIEQVARADVPEPVGWDTERRGDFGIYPLGDVWFMTRADRCDGELIPKPFYPE